MPQARRSGPPDCGGRFAIQSFLGAGGMGSVYEAYDRQRQSRVALKVMRQVGGPWIFRFKQEFRSLAGIVHPNLVTLHELIQWQDQWLFTMELVPGVSFSRSRRSSGPAPASTLVEATPYPPDRPEEPRGIAKSSDSRGLRRPLLFDELRLSDSLRQLCDGLDHLHRLGIAHADVKPSNALITPNGRVVILDFGISRDWRSEPADGDSPVFLGTPGYLAPERFEGHLATPASDMFSVGVTLFEVLAGRRLEGAVDAAAVLREGRLEGPADDSALVRRELLEGLCLRLLDRDPEARPTAAEVRDAVVSEGTRAGRRGAIPLAPDREEAAFVARAEELEAVRNALLDKRPQAPRIVIVSGESGIGKTELMRRIVDEELPGSCVVLQGTCYEREQVPYRALDRLIDSLSSKLLGVEARQLEALPWPAIAIVARMFPVLRRAPEIDRICASIAGPDDRDPREQRRAAAAVLAQLLALVSEGRRLVLYVDDLQWGDEESGSLLREILLSAKGLELRLVVCHRHPVESGVVARLVEGEPPIRHVKIRLDVLTPEESEELARALLGPDAATAHVSRVAAEANGNPFLIRELVQFGAGVDLDELALRSAVARHVELLSEQGRGVLEVLAVAGRRLEVGLVRRATGIGQSFEAALMLLRSQHLIKASDLEGEQIEPYHDRIREVIAQELPPATLAARHRDLARALEDLGDPDPAVLGFHLEGAGESSRAAECLLRAARNAEASLAPLNAAAHYAKVVGLVPEDDPRHLVALRGQAANLSAAGRGASAGPVYLQLAHRAGPGEALELRRHAAEAWVYAGEFDKARAALRSVLEAAGVREPRTLPGVLLAIARERLWILRRRYRHAACSEAQVAPERLLRVDANETAAELYSTIDLIRAYLAHSARVHESLAIGEPRRVARALIHEVVIGGIGGERSSRHGLELLRIAREATGHGDFPEERALIRYATGVHALLNGRYRDVVETLGELAHAPDLGRKGQQLRTVRSVIGYSRWWLGQWRAVAREYQTWILDAVERGDRVSAFAFRLEQGGQWAAVLADEPERAAEQVARTLASPLARELSFEHLAAKQTRAWLALYMGRADEAERVLRFRGTQRTYLRVQRSRVEIAVLHAFAALARGRAGLRRARSWMRRIEREGLAWAQPIVHLIAASIAAQQGQIGEGIARLEVAISLCEEQGFAMFAAAASWRLGELEGGAEGEARRAAGERRIAEQGAARPDRVVRTLAPGFRDAL